MNLEPSTHRDELRQRFAERVSQGYREMVEDIAATLRQVRGDSHEAEEEFGFPDPVKVRAERAEEERQYTAYLQARALEGVPEREQRMRALFEMNWPEDYQRLTHRARGPR